MTEPVDNTEKRGAGAIPAYRALFEYQAKFWAAVWQWPLAAMRHWQDAIRAPERRGDGGKEHKPTNADVDEAVEESFPASDPPSYNPGAAKPE